MAGIGYHDRGDGKMVSAAGHSVDHVRSNEFRDFTGSGDLSNKLGCPNKSECFYATSALSKRVCDSNHEACNKYLEDKQ